MVISVLWMLSLSLGMFNTIPVIRLTFNLASEKEKGLLVALVVWSISWSLFVMIGILQNWSLP